MKDGVVGVHRHHCIKFVPSPSLPVANGQRVAGPPAAVFYAVEGGKIKASRHYFDAMTMLKQIGAQPN